MCDREVIFENLREMIVINSSIYRNVYFMHKMWRSARTNLPLGAVVNDFSNNLYRSIRTTLVIELNCYLIRNPNQRNSIGTIVGEFENFRDRFNIEEQAVVDTIIQQYEEFLETNNEIIQDLNAMRDSGYAHVDNPANVEDVGHVDVCNVADLLEQSLTILNLMRVFIGEERLPDNLEMDGTIEESFRILNQRYFNW